MSVIQYLTNILCGTFMFLVMAAYMSVASGVAPLGTLMFFAPILMFGFVSGLSMFFPRIAAILSFFLALPSLYVGIIGMVYPSPGTEAIVFIVPASVVTFVSVGSLFWTKTSIWSRVQRPWVRVLVLIAAIAPAAYTVLFLANFFRSVTFNWN
ncbi:MAG: hypothetical protein ACKVQW_04695 [Pyrinomonadaceae bacterium]